MLKRAGMRLTADLMRDNSVDEETSSGLLLEDDWSFISFTGRKINGKTTIAIKLEFVGSTVTSNSAGNIGDQTVGTLPEGWIPQDTITSTFDKSGIAEGSVTITTDGTIILKTLSNTATIESGNNVTFGARWISENN